MPGMQKSYPSVKQDHPCCVCACGKFERQDPARVGGQGDGTGRQQHSGESELGKGDLPPPRLTGHRSDTDLGAELVVGMGNF